MTNNAKLIAAKDREIARLEALNKKLLDLLAGKDKEISIREENYFKILEIMGKKE